MEVLRHGNTYREVECKKCCALLSYCEADVKIIYDDEMKDGEWVNNDIRYIYCPECKNTIWIQS